MKVEFEKLIPKADQSFRAFYFDVIRKSNNVRCDYHSHPELEIVITIHGMGKRLIGDNLSDYGNNDLVLIGSNLPHYYTNIVPDSEQSRIEGMVIHFKRDFMGHGFMSLPESKSLNQLFDLASQGLVFSEKTTQEIIPIMYELRDSNGLTRLLTLIEILNTLSRSEGQTLASANYTTSSTNQMQQKRIDQAIQYTMKHFDTPLTLETVSKYCKMSSSTFSRLFNKSVGKSYKAFLIDVRIGHACKLLTQTDLSILEISEASGFTNLSNFNRRFLDKVNLTPKDYRKQAEISQIN